MEHTIGIPDLITYQQYMEHTIGIPDLITYQQYMEHTIGIPDLIATNNTWNILSAYPIL